MNLPERLSNAQYWTVIGPMGPKLPSHLEKLPILAVDGGASFSPHVDVWTGDHDSLKTELICEHQLVLNKAKDLSDLASAFQILDQTKATEFHLWGFMGGRLDHELFNIGEAINFLAKRPANKLYFYNHQGKILMQLFGKGKFQLDHKGTFSLATLSEAQIKLTGQCRYEIPVLKKVSPLSSFGLSNVGEGVMDLEISAPLIVLFPEMT